MRTKSAKRAAYVTPALSALLPGRLRVMTQLVAFIDLLI